MFSRDDDPKEVKIESGSLGPSHCTASPSSTELLEQGLLGAVQGPRPQLGLSPHPDPSPCFGGAKES